MALTLLRKSSDSSIFRKELSVTVKLVKRKQFIAGEKQTRTPKPDQLISTAQGWVKEFKARKARAQQSLGNLIRGAEQEA